MARKIEVEYGSDGWHDLHFSLFHETLGSAFASWQHVETALYILFHVLVRTDYNTSSAIFFHIQSNENRLALIKKLCRQQLNQRIMGTEWKRLDDRFRINFKVRNAMAHFEVIKADPEKNKIDGVTQFPVLMAPNHLDQYSKIGGQETVLTLETLMAKPEQFTRLADDIVYFCINRLPGWGDQVALLPPELTRLLEKYAFKVRQKDQT